MVAVHRMIETIWSDLAAFTDRDRDSIQQLAYTAAERLAVKWHRWRDKSSRGLLEYYRAADDFLYELALWHTTGEVRQRRIERTVQAAKRYGVRTVLDYGCGIGTDGICLADSGMQADLADLPTRALEFAAWRSKRYGLPVRILHIPEHDPDFAGAVEMLGRRYGPWDMVVCFDVIEHLGDQWPAVLDALARHCRVMALYIPFQNIDAPDVMHPQHFPQGDEHTEHEVMGKAGFVHPDDLIWVRPEAQLVGASYSPYRNVAWKADRQ